MPEIVLPIENDQVKRILVHRYPVLMIDRVTGLIPGQSITAVKCVSADGFWAPGHYPEPNPTVFPGFLELEASSQAIAIMLLTDENISGTPALAKIEEFSFKKPVRPGDQLIITAEMLRYKLGIYKAKVAGKVGDAVAFEGVLAGARLKVETTENEQ